MAIANFTDEERAAFNKAVLNLSSDELDVITTVVIGAPLDIYASYTNPKPVIVARFMVWIAKDKEKLCKILGYFCSEFEQWPERQQLLDHHARLSTLSGRPAVQPPDAFIIDSQVMVNRSRLRHYLRRLTEGAGYPVIAVNGPSQSGRSHSWHLIRHVAKTHGVNPLLIKLDAWLPEERTLENIFQRITGYLGLVAIDRPTTIGAQHETIGTRFAEALADAMEQQNRDRPVWLVFDSIDRPMDHNLTVFIRRICQLRQASTFRDCTIFILGSSEQIDLSDGGVQAEEIGPFLPEEISTAAKHINEFGVSPLPEDKIVQRCEALWNELARIPPAEVSRRVWLSLTDLRDQVDAW